MGSSIIVKPRQQAVSCDIIGYVEVDLLHHMKGKYMVLSEEHKRKISEGNRGQKRSEEARRNISESLKGHAMSEETKRKISEARKGKGRPQTEETKRKLSEANKGKTPWLGRQHSEETKRKIRESNLGKNAGKHPSEEVKQKISTSLKGRKDSEETRRRKSKALTGHDVSEETRQKLSEKTRGRVHSEEEKQHRRETMQQVRSAPEYLAKVSAGVRRAYEDPEFREKHVQHITSPEIREMNRARLAGRELPPEHKEKFVQAGQEAMIKYWEGKTYEERLELTRKGREASEVVKISSLELHAKMLLDAMGIQYEQQKQVGPYWVDFFLPEQNLVIEIYGCYWHGCETCGKAYPKKNAHDRSREAYIKACGYDLLIIWEHDIVEYSE